MLQKGGIYAKDGRGNNGANLCKSCECGPLIRPHAAAGGYNSTGATGPRAKSPPRVSGPAFKKKGVKNSFKKILVVFSGQTQPLTLFLATKDYFFVY